MSGTIMAIEEYEVQVVTLKMLCGVTVALHHA